eukprot:CAMPEP_0197835790 /NCGR_PEP_ID=MMETSP1437-20131217/26955_1 /TAXON_ID=49252 ORGANISM="Eucampia antarctica, Strain CCMP1452" /NCGR_SAMPLE_ID=MMETSP1437 /ASSEMBLY_ACC=CAM_ASM_001096 /LENGTH=141 /DNA_ID=CAMNT_0043441481 /DNA_START=25 /DNA_END=446 /DNA_ORIENTATION=+
MSQHEKDKEEIFELSKVHSPNQETTNEEEDDDYHNAILGLPPKHDSGGGNADYSSPPDSKVAVPNKQSGLFGASSNLVNSIVGAGIIGIPFAFRQSGLLVGLFLLLLVGYLTDKSLRIIVDLASFHPLLAKQDVRCYEDLA